MICLQLHSQAAMELEYQAPAVLLGIGEAGLWRRAEVVTGGPVCGRAGGPPQGHRVLPPPRLS